MEVPCVCRHIQLFEIGQVNLEAHLRARSTTLWFVVDVKVAHTFVAEESIYQRNVGPDVQNLVLLGGNER